MLSDRSSAQLTAAVPYVLLTGPQIRSPLLEKFIANPLGLISYGEYIFFVRRASRRIPLCVAMRDKYPFFF